VENFQGCSTWSYHRGFDIGAANDTRNVCASSHRLRLANCAEPDDFKIEVSVKVVGKAKTCFQTYNWICPFCAYFVSTGRYRIHFRFSFDFSFHESLLSLPFILQFYTRSGKRPTRFLGVRISTETSMPATAAEMSPAFSIKNSKSLQIAWVRGSEADTSFGNHSLSNSLRDEAAWHFPLTWSLCHGYTELTVNKGDEVHLTCPD
jgi:hypothetical protein